MLRAVDPHRETIAQCAVAGCCGGDEVTEVEGRAFACRQGQRMVGGQQTARLDCSLFDRARSVGGVDDGDGTPHRCADIYIGKGAMGSRGAYPIA